MKQTPSPLLYLLTALSILMIGYVWIFKTKLPQKAEMQLKEFRVEGWEFQDEKHKPHIFRLWNESDTVWLKADWRKHFQQARFEEQVKKGETLSLRILAKGTPEQTHHFLAYEVTGHEQTYLAWEDVVKAEKRNRNIFILGGVLTLTSLGIAWAYRPKKR